MVRPGVLERPAGAADPGEIDTTRPTKQLRIRRRGVCSACTRELAAGTEAVWDRAARALTCMDCTAANSPAVSVDLGKAGASARREYESRHLEREAHARQALGKVGVLLSKVIDEPQSTRAWQQGARGEERTAERLEHHLRGHEVRLLHDRRIPGHGKANIDHLAIGPGGVTVIDSKNYKGKVRVDRVGGLFCPRRAVLMIGGRDKTSLIDGVARQIGYVQAALDGFAGPAVKVRGALCFPNANGLPLLSTLSVRDIMVDGPKPVSGLARRPGQLTSADVGRLCAHLAQRFPAA